MSLDVELTMGACCFNMWLCGLVYVQVMCQSDNQILSHCFRREEVIDQKRPEMVRRDSLSFALFLALALALTLSFTHV